MIVAFASNYLNHHQLPLALAFYNRPDITYYFLAFEPMSQSRIQMGYEDMNDEYPFVIKAYESTEQKQKALQIIQMSDIFISSISDEHIRLRLNAGKRVYRFSERFQLHSCTSFVYSTLICLLRFYLNVRRLKITNDQSEQKFFIFPPNCKKSSPQFTLQGGFLILCCQPSFNKAIRS